VNSRRSWAAGFAGSSAAWWLPEKALLAAVTLRFEGRSCGASCPLTRPLRRRHVNVMGL